MVSHLKLMNLQVNGCELAFISLLACENDYRYQSFAFLFKPVKGCSNK